MRYLSAGFLLFCMAATSHARKDREPEPWKKERRVSRIQKTLLSFQGSTERLISLWKTRTFDAGQGKCRSTLPGLKDQCLMKEMAGYCRRSEDERACLDVSDVLITNMMSQNQFLSHRERFQLLKKGGSYTQHLKRALFEKYAALAMEFYLTGGCQKLSEPCFSEEIDRFCQNNSERGKFPWAGCVGALIWFISRS